LQHGRCAKLAPSKLGRAGRKLLWGQGTTKFVVGATVGAVGGFAVGAYASTTTAQSARQSVLSGLDVSARFLGRTVIQAVDSLGSVLESGYTRIRGREKYLEHEIDELREQIARLQQRID
jgi:hypothetical protein